MRCLVSNIDMTDAFCTAYLGIPLTMLVLANLGRSLLATVTSTFNKFVWRRLRPLSEPVEDTNPFILLAIFAAYLLVGTVGMISKYPNLPNRFDF